MKQTTVQLTSSKLFVIAEVSRLIATDIDATPLETMMIFSTLFGRVSDLTYEEAISAGIYIVGLTDNELNAGVSRSLKEKMEKLNPDTNLIVDRYVQRMIDYVKKIRDGNPSDSMFKTKEAHDEFIDILTKNISKD